MLTKHIKPLIVNGRLKGTGVSATIDFEEALKRHIQTLPVRVRVFKARLQAELPFN